MALEAVDWLLQLRVRAEAIRSTPGLLLYLAMECCVTEKENGSHHSGTTVLPRYHHDSEASRSAVVRQVLGHSRPA